LTDIEQVIVPGHSLSNVDAAYFTSLLEQRNVAAATGLSLASPSMTGLRSERNSTARRQYGEFWHKSLERVANDPEGAITAARSLLETICKHILDDHGIDYPEDIDLPKLWTSVGEQLNLARSQHQEKFSRLSLVIAKL